MELEIMPGYALTTDHSASSYGLPVLVKKDTGEAFGPNDILQWFPSWQLEPVKKSLRRAIKIYRQVHGDLTQEQSDLISDFLSQCEGVEDESENDI